MGVMNSLCALAVLSLSSLALGAPRELDHIDHFHQRESFGRGLLRAPLPVPLALTETPEPETQSDTDNEIETGAESVSDISNFVNIKIPVPEFSPKTTITTTPTPPTYKPTSTLPPLEWYYKFIERNQVDESNRGGNSFITFSCCHQIRRQ